MPRSVRIEYPGALYHVMARGNRRDDIFLSDSDREMFLNTLGQACERTGWRVLAWVLMSNHYHLALQTPEANLVAGMTWLQTTYTRRFNCRHWTPSNPGSNVIRTRQGQKQIPISCRHGYTFSSF